MAYRSRVKKSISQICISNAALGDEIIYMHKTIMQLSKGSFVLNKILIKISH